MNILFVMRTAGYFPYHQTTIEHLLKRGHRITLLFEHDSGLIDERGFHEWLEGGRQITVALVHNSRSRSIIALHPEIRGPA